MRRNDGRHRYVAAVGAMRTRYRIEIASHVEEEINGQNIPTLKTPASTGPVGLVGDGDTTDSANIT